MSAVDELSPVARGHVERAVESLADEFGEMHSRDVIERVMDDSVSTARPRRGGGRLPADARAPVRARASEGVRRAHGPESAVPDVLFIGLGDTGRGQMAAALLTLRSEGASSRTRRGARSGVEVDPAVVTVMAELCVDLTEAYAKPLSHEVLGAAPSS